MIYGKNKGKSKLLLIFNVMLTLFFAKRVSVILEETIYIYSWGAPS